MIDAVIFDLDGVLIDSEQLWDRARRETVAAQGAQWPPGATEAMQGMSSTEWSAYLHAIPGMRISAQEISSTVVDRLLALYREGLPLNPGAVAAVRRLSERWPLGLASSSNREVIEVVLARGGMGDLFAATVSSEEVRRGKPDPDVYLDVAHRLSVSPLRAAAVEDSSNGIRSALAAGTCVLVLPNPQYPPDPGVLESAHLVLGSLDDLTVEAVMQADGNRTRRTEARIDEQEVESFPASDPHADWAGPR